MDPSITPILRAAFHASRPVIRRINIRPLHKCLKAAFYSIDRTPLPYGAEGKRLQIRTYSSARKNLERSILVHAKQYFSHPDIFDTQASQRLFFRPASMKTPSSAQVRTEVSVEQYHYAADMYLDNVQRVMEELQEEREDVDVEFSVCLLAGT